MILTMPSADPALQTLLARSSALHGHLCPRQILGVRLALAAGRALGLAFPRMDKRVLVFVCDTGNKYLSKMYNDYWMLDNGFIERPQHGDLRDLILRPYSQKDTVVVAPTDLLIRLFHEETPRVFDPQRVEFGCSCTEDRVRDTLSIYSAKDIAHMTTPEGRVTADCQFCGAHYDFDPRSLGFEATMDADGNPIEVAG